MAIEKLIDYFQGLGWRIVYRPGAVIAVWDGEYGYVDTEVNLSALLRLAGSA